MTLPQEGRAPFGPLLAALDDAADAAFDRLRGRRAVDLVAAVVSNVSDFGVVWVVTAAVKAHQPGAGRRRAALALGAAGISSYLVNRVAKHLVGRERPVGGPARHRGAVPVRRPSSTSFPSGHTLAAWCTAVVLPEGRGRAVALTLAAAVAASRVHLRAHHASDVVAGAVIGAVTGLAVRKVVDALA